MALWLVFPTILLLNALLGEAQPIGLAGCKTQCGGIDIPYPFGMDRGCYLGESYQIVCQQGSDSSSALIKPFINGTDPLLEVMAISVEKALVQVRFPTAYACPYGEERNVFVDLDGSPFVLSTNNRFIAVGCNNLALMTQNESTVGGCISICQEGSKAFTNNTCSGIECCQTTIPSNLKVFNLTLQDIDHGNKGREEQCKYAFLVDQTWFDSGSENPNHTAQMDSVPVVLEWGMDHEIYESLVKNGSFASPVMNGSFESLVKNGFLVHNGSRKAYNCRNYTGSDNPSPMMQCFCAEGFGGNPYLPNGCQDIDECTNPDNICRRSQMQCLDFYGNYGCVFAHSKRSRVKIVVSGIGMGLGLLLLLIGAWWLRKVLKKRKKKQLKEKYFKRNGGLLLQEQLSSGEVNVDKIKMFSSKELEKATDHYNVNRLLGQGAQGTVYKGMLTDGQIVAVKKSKLLDEGKLKQFINEVVILSQINHRNVVKLLGCCLETEVPLLVYEFIPNGTLFQFLHDQNEEFPLTWNMRLRIALEVSGALSYLHSAASIPIYHRDIKSANILLDDKYRAKVADFGTSRSVNIDQTHITTEVKGTFGYLDPEYFQSNQFTDKSDVYSFGVVLIELLTGQKPISSTRTEGGRNLAAYFILSMEENHLFDILDSQVMKQGKIEEILAVANLARRCLDLNGKKRPTMKEVTIELETIQKSQSPLNIPQSCAKVEYNINQLTECSNIISIATASIFDSGASSSLDIDPSLSKC